MDVGSPTPLEAAILRTLLYGDVFSFPMTPGEIHHFLIHDRPVSSAAVEDVLAGSEWLAARIYREHGYVSLVERRELVALREEREIVARQLWPRALRYGRWLSRLPFVQMVALTGALAMRNAPAEDDDLDYLVVTTANRVWLARAFTIVLVRLARLWGVEICPNYVVSETRLAQDRYDLFMAHEVAQIVPLYGNGLYDELCAANRWLSEFLPNAAGAHIDPGEQPIGRGWLWLKRGGEILLAGWPGDALERWEYRRKLTRFAEQMKTPHSAAQLDPHRVKGHFHDHGYPVMRRYQEQVRAFGVESTHESWAVEVQS